MQLTRAVATVAAFATLLLSLAAGTVPAIAPAPATTQPAGNEAIKVVAAGTQGPGPSTTRRRR